MKGTGAESSFPSVGKGQSILVLKLSVLPSVKHGVSKGGP